MDLCCCSDGFGTAIRDHGHQLQTFVSFLLFPRRIWCAEYSGWSRITQLSFSDPLSSKFCDSSFWPSSQCTSSRASFIVSRWEIPALTYGIYGQELLAKVRHPFLWHDNGLLGYWCHCYQEIVVRLLYYYEAVVCRPSQWTTNNSSEIALSVSYFIVPVSKHFEDDSIFFVIGSNSASDPDTWKI